MKAIPALLDYCDNNNYHHNNYHHNNYHHNNYHHCNVLCYWSGISFFYCFLLLLLLLPLLLFYLINLSYKFRHSKTLDVMLAHTVQHVSNAKCTLVVTFITIMAIHLDRVDQQSA
jgi:hypothetical protein